MPQKAPSIARRCPHDIRSTKRRHPRSGDGLKSTLRGFSNGLSLRQSRSRGSQRAGTAPGPLLRLLGAPDGLAGDAEGPRHRGLGLPVAAQQADGGGLIDSSSVRAAQAIPRGQRSDQESPGLA